MRPLEEIAQHRQELSARSAALREALAADSWQLRKPLGAADHVLGIAHFVRAHPVLFGTAIAVVVALLGGRMKVLPAVGRGLAVWRIVQTVSALLIERQRARDPAPK